MKRFNLSEWAIRHRSLVTYLMLIIVLAGIGSYLRLGRSEDPDFTVKTMVVQVAWPGATVGDTLEQITDRLERKLQETPSLDYVKSFTTAGKATIFVNLKDSTPAAQVPDIWYQVRKKIGDIRNTLPQGIVGPGFNDEFGDTYGIVYGFTADGFTHRELRDYVEDLRKQLLEPFDNAAHAQMQTQIFGPSTPFYSWGYPPYFLAIAGELLASLPYLGTLVLWQGLSLSVYLASIRRILPFEGALPLALAFPGVFNQPDAWTERLPHGRIDGGRARSPREARVARRGNSLRPSRL